MDKYELDDIIFDKCCEVLSNNDNWIEYGDLLYQTTEKVKEVIPEITMEKVEEWIKDCIQSEYISVARSRRDEITADDYCRGEWLGLDDDPTEDSE